MLNRINFDELFQSNMIEFYAQSSNQALYLFFNVRLTYDTVNKTLSYSGNGWSNMTGYTLGLSYRQQNFWSSTQGNTFKYDVNGTLNFNFLIDGVGTVFTNQVKIKGQKQFVSQNYGYEVINVYINGRIYY